MAASFGKNHIRTYWFCSCERHQTFGVIDAAFAQYAALARNLPRNAMNNGAKTPKIAPLRRSLLLGASPNG